MSALILDRFVLGMRDDVFDVCIVGAGLAGLSCALRVKELNPDARVIVVEARDRPGERLHH